jgi:hypothetical protein
MGRHPIGIVGFSSGLTERFHPIVHDCRSFVTDALVKQVYCLGDSLLANENRMDQMADLFGAHLRN